MESLWVQKFKSFKTATKSVRDGACFGTSQWLKRYAPLKPFQMPGEYTSRIVDERRALGPRFECMIRCAPQVWTCRITASASWPPAISAVFFAGLRFPQTEIGHRAVVVGEGDGVAAEFGVFELAPHVELVFHTRLALVLGGKPQRRSPGVGRSGLGSRPQSPNQ